MYVIIKKIYEILWSVFDSNKLYSQLFDAHLLDAVNKDQWGHSRYLSGAPSSLNGAWRTKENQTCRFKGILGTYQAAQAHWMAPDVRKKTKLVYIASGPRKSKYFLIKAL